MKRSLLTVTSSAPSYNQAIAKFGASGKKAKKVALSHVGVNITGSHQDLACN